MTAMTSYKKPLVAELRQNVHLLDFGNEKRKRNDYKAKMKHIWNVIFMYAFIKSSYTRLP